MIVAGDLSDLTQMWKDSPPMLLVQRWAKRKPKTQKLVEPPDERSAHLDKLLLIHANWKHGKPRKDAPDVKKRTDYASNRLKKKRKSVVASVVLHERSDVPEKNKKPAKPKLLLKPKPQSDANAAVYAKRKWRQRLNAAVPALKNPRPKTSTHPKNDVAAPAQRMTQSLVVDPGLSSQTHPRKILS
jgi:hypothetical protein